MDMLLVQRKYNPYDKQCDTHDDTGRRFETGRKEGA